MALKEVEEEGEAVGVGAVAAREGDWAGFSSRVVFSEVEEGGKGVRKAGWIGRGRGDVEGDVVPEEEGAGGGELA